MPLEVRLAVQKAPARLPRVLAIAAGLALIAYGYAFHRTTLIRQQAAAAAQPDPSDDFDDWDEDPPAPDEPSPFDELDPFEELDKRDQEELAAQDPEPQPAPPPAEEAVTVTEWGLVRGAATGTIGRLADGRLLLKNTAEKAAPT